MIERFNGFALWARIVIIGCVIFLGWFLATSALSGIKHAIFGNPEVKRERANTVVAEEMGDAARETGVEATNTIVRTHERYVEIDRTVREGQDAVNRANRGEQMAPDIDAARADALCRVHDSLCRQP